jgi:ketosteroid isomerase-like protein
MSKPLVMVSTWIWVLILSTSVGWAGSAEEEVRQRITAMAQALNDMPKMGDVQSVLNFYAHDYAGIADGEWQTRDDLQAGFADILGHPKDIPVSLSYQVSNIQTHTINNMVWATYEYAVQTGIGGQPIDKEHGLCTTIFTKTGARWRIQHDHCSTPKDTDNDANQTRGKRRSAM